MAAKDKDKSRGHKDHTIRIKDVEAVQAELIELKERVEVLQAEKDDVFAKLQRVSADYTNFQRRVPKQVSDSVAYEKERLIRSLLPVMDNFEHTLANMASADGVEVVVKGVQMIYSQMLDVLKGHDVEQISALGEKFDPSRHEAMMRRSDPEKEDGVVLEEFLKGYLLNGRVIRPSKVIVNKIEAIEKLPQDAQKEPTEAAGDADATATAEDQDASME